jgi:hypothetical protein
MFAAEILAAAAKNLLDLGRLDLARHVSGLALAENAQCANAHSVQGVVHDVLAEWRDRLEHARCAVESQPGSPQLKYNLALSTLRLDDYPKGFALIRCRSGSNRLRDHCRHHGGALRGRFGPSGMDHGSLFAALVLGGRTRSDDFVSDSAAVSPECSTGLVECRREDDQIFEGAAGLPIIIVGSHCTLTRASEPDELLDVPAQQRTA